jgi:hypothetical protein
MKDDIGRKMKAVVISPMVCGRKDGRWKRKMEEKEDEGRCRKKDEGDV